MPEPAHLADAFDRHFSNPIHSAFTNFVVISDGLTAAQAASVPGPRFNSVWAITNHVWFWQEALLRLLRGEKVDCADLGAADWSGWPPAGEPADESGWQAARQRTLDCNLALTKFIAGMSAEELEEQLTAWRSPKHQAINSILVHNAYHTCEIISVRHMQGFWVEKT